MSEGVNVVEQQPAETRKLKNEILTIASILLYEDIPFLIETKRSSFYLLVKNFRLRFNSTGNLVAVYDRFERSELPGVGKYRLLAAVEGMR